MSKKTLKRKSPKGNKIREVLNSKPVTSMVDLIGLGHAVLTDYVNDDLSDRESNKILSKIDKAITSNIVALIQNSRDSGAPVVQFLGCGAAPIDQQIENVQDYTKAMASLASRTLPLDPHSRMKLLRQAQQGHMEFLKTVKALGFGDTLLLMPEQLGDDVKKGCDVLDQATEEEQNATK